MLPFSFVQFAKTCMSGYAVCGRNTVGKKRTGMSGKVSLTDIDTVALSRAESVDQAKKRWTILDTVSRSQTSALSMIQRPEF